ncbi:hypothetical protein G6F56_002318 [Rhizopus delemar]|nr:hypothetical protein G6F56_002318 [Rhizopus delemar]
MREQAFVVFADVASAATAKRSLNGFTFLGHSLKIDYAKTKSDAIAHLDGTYRLRNQPAKRPAEEDLEDTPSKVKKTDEQDDEDDEDDSDDDHA